MARNVSGELTAVSVPPRVALGLLRQVGALAIEREHAIGIERQEIPGVEILRLFEWTTSEPHGRQRQWPRTVRHGELNPLREARRHEPGRAAGDEFKKLSSRDFHLSSSPKPLLTCHFLPLLFVRVDVLF